MNSSDPELNRLRWRCRRGMRELDTVLMRFTDQHYTSASAADQAAFRKLLSMPDPEILGLMTGKLRSDDAGINSLVERLLAERLS